MQEPTTNTLIPCREESVDFDTTQNLFIEAENLEALKILQKAYAGQVKMIYIDPPYNMGNDSFIYPDKFSETREEYARRVGDTDDNGYLQKDGLFQGAFRKNAKDNGHYHSNWLNMMLPRLHLAKTLLADDGVIFISIDDNEQAQLKLLCDEVFGEENFVATFPWRKRTAKSDVPFGVSQDYEWIICYAKSNIFRASIEKNTRKYFETPDFPNRPWRIHDMTKQTTAAERPNSFFTMVNPKTGDEYPCDPNRTWRITKDTFQQYYDKNEIVFPGDYDFLKIKKPVARYFKDNDMKKDGDNFGKVAVSTKLPDDIGMSLNGTKEIKEVFENVLFPFPKTILLIKYLIQVSNTENSLILDFFSGSGTTAHAVMQLNAEDGGNRRYICVQLPEETDEKSEAAKAGFATIAEIAKERIRRAGAKIKAENPNQNIDTGFKVFKLSESHFKQWKTHLTSKEIATPATQARNDGLNSGSLNGTQQLDLLSDFQDVVQNGATLENMAYEIALRLGFQLTDEFDFSGSIVWLDNHQKTRKMALLLKQYHQDLLDEILSAKPVKVFALDKIFNGDDALKVNTALQLQDANIDFETL